MGPVGLSSPVPTLAFVKVREAGRDGRLTRRPDATGTAWQRFTWDDLGRLTGVTNDAGTVTLAGYTYDPLDRLRMVDYGAGNRVRFRYLGLTTSAVQTIDDATGSVTRHIGSAWTGAHLEDWTGSGQNLRIYGTNSHHDLTWTAGSSGAVTATVRYDPWGTVASATGSVPDFRFQGSYADDTTKLSWAVTRWYAPAQGRFISEDSLLGEPKDPDSRHLYAYAEGDAVRAWDPDGMAPKDAWWNLSWHLYKMMTISEPSPTARTIHLAGGAFCGSVAIAGAVLAETGIGLPLLAGAVLCDAADGVIGTITDIVFKGTEYRLGFYWGYYYDGDWRDSIWAIRAAHFRLDHVVGRDALGRQVETTSWVNDSNTFLRWANASHWAHYRDSWQYSTWYGWTLRARYQYGFPAGMYHSNIRVLKVSYSYHGNPVYGPRSPGSGYGYLRDEDSRYYAYGSSWHYAY